MHVGFFHTTVCEGKLEVNNNPNFLPLFLLSFIIIMWKLCFISPFFCMLAVVKHKLNNNNLQQPKYIPQAKQHSCNDSDKIQSHYKSPTMVDREAWIYPQVL